MRVATNNTQIRAIIVKILPGLTQALLMNLREKILHGDHTK